MALTDDYAWLKDENWQEVLRNPARLDPDIRSYLEAENRHTEALLAPTLALHHLLLSQERRRLHEEDGKGAEDGLLDGVCHIPTGAMIGELFEDWLKSAQQGVNREAFGHDALDEGGR